MNERIMQWKGATTAVLLVLLLSIAGLTKAQTENITFADATVKAYCVANWDTNGDGELSYDEAAAVTSLDGVFMFDGDITSFDELQFFTGLTSFGEDEFNSCTNLAAITIPSAVTSIGNYAFSDCSSLVLITSYACAPPALGSNVFDNVPSAVVLNVPCHTAALYQAADGWSDFSIYEEFEYGLCPIIFADDNVKAICVAHWDTNGDGELSYAEAAAVTNLGIYFKSTSITSFDELEYFTCLTTIPNTAFYGCTSLVSIALSSSVSALGNGSFYNCTSLATMTVYAETPPTVGTNAFKNVPTTMVVHVPCGTYEAYHTASGWNEFTIIQQSGSCPIVFADANVKALCVANWDTNGDGELSYDEAAAVTDLGTVFKNQYYNITSFNELQYFTGLTSIGSDAFYYCYGLTSIEIPNSVTLIDNYAFYYCTSLTSVEIPSSVTSIGNEAFYNCSSLTSVEIPNSVTSIGSHAFFNCSGFTGSLTIPNSVTTIEGFAFYNCSELTGSLTIPNSVTSIGSNAFDNCSGFTGSLTIPNSVTSIGIYTFYNCSGLTSLTIGNSVTSIGNYAFRGCRNLISITIHNETPPTVGNDAFNNVPKTIPVYVPCGTANAYQAANGWSEFTSYQETGCPTEVHFITSGVWNEPSNWRYGAMPSQNDIVFIDAPCQLDMDAEVADLTISDGQSLTLQAGKILTVTDTLTNSAVSGLIIEDSAQLIHNNAGVQATVKKTIAGYGTSEDKWYFITNPITDSIIPSSGNGLLSSNYDLYYCFPTSADRLEWRNYKSGAFALHNGEGYLYANETGTELSFGGTLAPSNSNVMRTVSYEVGNNSPGNGWTFLGNPFACNCYLVDANGNPLTIYKMNADGTGLVEVLSGPIAPMEGFFYYTTETRNVYFSRTVPVGLSK